jgi:hypothetical protein
LALDVVHLLLLALLLLLKVLLVVVGALATAAAAVAVVCHDLQQCPTCNVESGVVVGCCCCRSRSPLSIDVLLIKTGANGIAAQP